MIQPLEDAVRMQSQQEYTLTTFDYARHSVGLIADTYSKILLVTISACIKEPKNYPVMAQPRKHLPARFRQSITGDKNEAATAQTHTTSSMNLHRSNLWVLKNRAILYQLVPMHAQMHALLQVYCRAGLLWPSWPSPSATPPPRRPAWPPANALLASLH